MLDQTEYRAIEELAQEVATAMQREFGDDAAVMWQKATDEERRDTALTAGVNLKTTTLSDGDVAMVLNMTGALLWRMADAIHALSGDELQLVTPTEAAGFIPKGTRHKIQTLCRQNELEWCWDIYGTMRLITKKSLIALKQRGINRQPGRPARAAAV